MEKTKSANIFELNGRTIRLKTLPQNGETEFKLPIIAQNEIDKDFKKIARGYTDDTKRYFDGYYPKVLNSKQSLACQDYVYGSAELDCIGLENLQGAKIIVPNACSLALQCDENKPLKLHFVLPSNMRLYIVNLEKAKGDWANWELIAHKDLEDCYEFDGSDGHFIVEPYSKRYSLNQFDVSYPESENE